MTRHLQIFLTLGGFILCACETVKPDDKLQKVLAGDIFGGSNINPDEEKKREQSARENQRVMPRKEEPKGLGLKMEF